MDTDVMISEQVEAKKNEELKIGVSVMLLLAVFTIGEYWLGSIAVGWWVPLLLIAGLKAFLVMRDYMHLGRVFAVEEDGHE